jgi:hypothetical protein
LQALRFKALAAASRHRVLLAGFSIAVVSVLTWRSTVRSESMHIAPSAAVDGASAPEPPLEITVIGAHDSVATPPVPPEPPVAVPRPVAAPPSVDRPPASVPTPSRAILGTRSAPARGQSSSGAKVSPLPATINAAPAQEPRVEVAPAKPQPKPDGPPVEINPYVYK